MKYLLLFFLNCTTIISLAQTTITDTIKRKSLIIDRSKDKPKAKYNQYRIITLSKDTTYIDTTLTISNSYKFNYLRKDIFGLLPFANEGQTYNSLKYRINASGVLPEMGFKAKTFNFIDFDQVNYYSVATPTTDLYYKTAMEQGQTLQALVAVNLSERFNFSVSYKGHRSLGKYFNQLSSTGNFVFTTSYATKTNQYNINFHYTDQDALNGENGGITNIDNFTSGDENFSERARIAVNQSDAKSYLKAKRIFAEQTFRLNSIDSKNTFAILHQFNYENKNFEYNQATVTNVAGKNFNNQYGFAYINTNINDQTHYNKMRNKLALICNSQNLGKLQFAIEDFRDNSYYFKTLIINNNIVPSSLSNKLSILAANYTFTKKKYEAHFSASKAITTKTISSLDAVLQYNHDANNQFAIQLQNSSKLPDNNFNLHQSNFQYYNWSNNFKNEKTTNLQFTAQTNYGTARIQLSNIQDYLYFANDSLTRQIITPKQFASSINYASIELHKEFKFRKIGLDNTFLFQEVQQDAKILNLPLITTRNTLYYADFMFKKALYYQTGATFNYFSKYFANDYNPILGEFFIQKNKKIGNFPVVDVFLNAKIRQTRLFFIFEHVNALFTPNNYLTAPNHPYRDFMFRFGLVWNFFQ